MLEASTIVKSLEFKSGKNSCPEAGVNVNKYSSAGSANKFLAPVTEYVVGEGANV